MSTLKTQITELAKKAAAAEKADDAMKLAQAALNLANASITIRNEEHLK